MDGLLIDTEPVWRAAQSAVFAGIGIALRESENRFSTIFEQSPVGKIMMDRDFRVSAVNHQGVEGLYSNETNATVNIIKPGQNIGATDELGFAPAEDRVHVHDLQATILHLLGLDHRKLTFRFQGRDFRLTDVHGNVVKKILV